MQSVMVGLCIYTFEKIVREKNEGSKRGDIKKYEIESKCI